MRKQTLNNCLIFNPAVIFILTICLVEKFLICLPLDSLYYIQSVHSLLYEQGNFSSLERKNPALFYFVLTDGGDRSLRCLCETFQTPVFRMLVRRILWKGTPKTKLAGAQEKLPPLPGNNSSSEPSSMRGSRFSFT